MEAFGARMRGGLATMLSVALIVSGALLAAPAANAEEVTPPGEAPVASAPVVETPAEEAPAEVAPAPEAPTEDAVADAPAEEAPAEVAPAVSAPADSQTETAPNSLLSATATPALTSTEAPRDGGEITVSGAGFNPAYPGVYIAIGPAGLSGFYAGAGDLLDTVYVSVTNVDGSSDAGRTAKLNADGTFSLKFTVPAFAESTAYSLYVSKAHGQGMADTSQNVIADVIYAAPPAAPAPANPQLVLSKTELDPTGDSLTVTGTGFDASFVGLLDRYRCEDSATAKKGFYVQLGWITDDWRPSTGGKNKEDRLGGPNSWFADGTTNCQAPSTWTIEDDGTASFTYTFEGVTPESLGELPAGARYAAFTSGAGGGTQAVNEIAADIEFVTPPVKATTSVTSQGLKVDVTATGLPGGIYAALIERGTGADLDMSKPDSYAAFALPFPKVTDGAASFSLSAPADKLDRAKEYEVLVWKIHSMPNADTTYGQTNVSVTSEQWDELFPAPTGPSIVATVTDASGAGLKLSVSLANVQIPVGKFGAYVGVIEKDRVAEYGSDAGAGMVEQYIKTSDFVDGSASLELPVPKDKKDRDGTTTIRSLDPSKQYVVVSWLAHGFLTDEVKVAEQDLVVTKAQWDELQGIKPPVDEPAVTPKPTAPGAGSLTWGVSTPFADYVTGNISKGTVATSGVGGGRGGYVFPQATGSSWNADTRTGTVYYSGNVTFIGHGGLLRETFANPVITVSSPISGTISAHGQSFPLNLTGAGFTANADGSVTWSNVSVSGVISGGDGGGAGGELSVDSLSFTVGSTSGLNFGSTTTTSPFAQVRTAAATPPAATGLTVVTPAAKLVAGGEVEITAGGFEPNEQGILVVIYSEPTVLDTNAKADKDGVVRWIGKLPKDLTGKHTLTLQGSISVGQEITIAAADSLKKTAKPAAAPVVSGEMQTASALPDMGAPAWIWWVSALALLVIAGASTGLVVAQRRKNDTPDRL